MRGDQLANNKFIIAGLGLLWAVAVGAGIKLLWDFSLAPGKSAAPPAVWPSDCQIQRDSSRATIVMLAHPRCPCTRASIGELSRLMTSCQGKVAAYVVFYKPEGFDRSWSETDLWENAAEIPGVNVLSDEAGNVARSFNAATSGQVVVYDAGGNLVFNGGITAARGHAGDNSGRTAITSLLTDKTEGHFEVPVFGCPLFDPHNKCTEEIPQCSK